MLSFSKGPLSCFAAGAIFLACGSVKRSDGPGQAVAGASPVGGGGGVVAGAGMGARGPAGGSGGSTAGMETGVGGTGPGAGSGGNVGSPDCTRTLAAPETRVQNQAQVEALRGVTKVEGNLNIDAVSNGPTDLQPLICLTEVTGTLTIATYSPLKNLRGLEQLQRVGKLQISGNRELVDLGGLKHLGEVATDMTIRENPKLRSFEALQSLSTIGGALTIEDNPSLSAFEGLDALTRVGGNVSISRNHALANVDGLGNLTAIGGTLSIHTNAALERIDALGALSEVGPRLDIIGNSQLVDLGGLESLRVAAELKVSGNPLLSGIEGLRNLTKVDTLIIEGSTELSSLSSLAKLTEVGALNLAGLPKLTKLAGLENLKKVSVFNATSLAGLTSLADFGQLSELGRLSLDDLPMLQSLAGLEHLGEVRDTLTLAGIPVVDLKPLSGLSVVGGDLGIRSTSLASLDGLQQLTRVGGTLRLGGNEKLKTLDGLEHVQDIGALDVDDNPLLQSLSGMAALTQVGRAGAVLAESITIWDVPALEDLGLHALTAVYGGISIRGTALTSLSGLDNLKSIGGSFYVQDAAQLKSLDGLNSLTSVQNITVWGCPQFVSLRALASLESIPSGCLFRENTKLPTCEVEWLDTLLATLGTSSGYSETDDNGVCP
jgi:hypothetical protein